MTDVFVDDGGSNTSPYETWAKSATTYQTGVGQLAAGDRLIFGHDHIGLLGASTTFTFPGTASQPNLIISALSSAGGSTVTYTKATANQIDLTDGGNHDMTLRGHTRHYGVQYKIGDDLKFDTAANSKRLLESFLSFSNMPIQK